MIRSVVVLNVAILGLGAGACSALAPYDYSKSRQGESAEAGIVRQETEARERQERIVRCQTMSERDRRVSGDCF